MCPFQRRGPAILLLVACVQRLHDRGQCIHTFTASRPCGGVLHNLEKGCRHADAFASSAHETALAGQPGSAHASAGPSAQWRRGCSCRSASSADRSRCRASSLMRASGMLREYKTEDAPGSTFDGSHFLTAPCDKVPRVDVCAYCPNSGPAPKNQLLMDNEFHVRPTGAWKAMLGRRRPMPGSKTTRRATTRALGAPVYGSSWRGSGERRMYAGLLRRPPPRPSARPGSR